MAPNLTSKKRSGLPAEKSSGSCLKITSVISGKKASTTTSNSLRGSKLQEQKLFKNKTCKHMVHMRESREAKLVLPQIENEQESRSIVHYLGPTVCVFVWKRKFWRRPIRHREIREQLYTFAWVHCLMKLGQFDLTITQNRWRIPMKCANSNNCIDCYNTN